MPEILEGAATYFKSESIDDLKNVLKEELRSVEENSTCGERGMQQAKKFNWRNEAEKLICFLSE